MGGWILFINVGNVAFHNFFWCKLVFIRFELSFFVREPICPPLTNARFREGKRKRSGSQWSMVSGGQFPCFPG